ncbi:beta-glucosidase [Phellopilus nigrolimitatus]|nr:beta-glucosidase [Phellopilus nigrolimitatus]
MAPTRIRSSATWARQTQSVLLAALLASAQTGFFGVAATTLTSQAPSDSLSTLSSASLNLTDVSSVAPLPSVTSTLSASGSLTSTESASVPSESTVPSGSFSTSSFTLSASGSSVTLSSTGVSVPLSSTFSLNATSTVTINASTTSFTPGSTASGTGPGGINVQPSPDPAEQHPFTPFPSSTQGPSGSVFPATDPLSPPPVSSDPQTIPDFNSAWATAWSKAEALIGNFSIEQKVNFSTGVGWENGRCVGNTPPVPAEGSGVWKGLCLEDSPLGVRDTDFATVFPAGINAASTWQRSLIRQRGVAMGQEHKGKGVHVALGPMMNLGRIAQGGRNWEGFGADPFLSGEAAYETILGMQSSGIQACAKHFINNEQEHERTMESSNVADRAEHELYAHPFLRSVMAGVASVMCSYNQINETYACENDRTLNQILKGEFGFRGYIMSDWSAQHSTLSAVYGLDMTMPGDVTFDSGTSYFGGNLTAFVNNGSIAEARLDDMATRIAAAWYFIHQDDPSYPSVNFNAFNPIDPATNERVDVQDDHYQIVRQIGAASSVLLKNQNGTLPLNKPRSLVLIGSDAGPQPGGPNEFTDNGGNAGILAMGWGSGTANFTYLVSPLDAIQFRARQDRTTVNWLLDDFDTATAGNVAIQADVALVFVNSDSGEEYINVDGNDGDRNNLTAWHGGDALIAAVAAQNPNTVVVVHSVGPLILEPWIEHPNVSAVVWAGLGGTETGNALVDVLYGDVNPSGRLPYTIAKNTSDYPAQPVPGGGGNTILQIPYTENLLIDYRHFDALGIDPRFEFGFGLSYTTFAYSSLSVQEVSGSASPTLVANWKKGDPSPNGDGSSAALWLHEPAFEVTFNVQNTGDVAGVEIPQLYVNHPASAGEPPSILRGFTDINLQPGETQAVTLSLSRYDLSVWDVVTQSWRRPVGTIKFFVGASSRDVRLKGSFPN